MNEKNLKSLKDRPIEERKEIARKGALASAKTKQENAKVREILKKLMYSKADLNKEQQQELKQLGIDDKELTNGAVMVCKLFERATYGDTQSIKLITELLGEDNRTQQFSKNLEIKERELQLKEKELELKEQAQEIKLNIDDSISDKVVFVEINGGNASKEDIQRELELRGLGNAKNVIIDDLSERA